MKKFIYILALVGYLSPTMASYWGYNGWEYNEAANRTVNLSHTPKNFLREQNLLPDKAHFRNLALKGLQEKHGHYNIPEASQRMSVQYIEQKLQYKNALSYGSFSLESVKPSWKSSISDQGQLGTCASFAAIEALEFLYSDYKNVRELSQPYLINEAEKRHNCINDGLPIGMAMETAQSTGSIGRHLWTYEKYTKKVIYFNDLISSDDFSENTNLCVGSPYTPWEDQDYTKYTFSEIVNIFADTCNGSECTRSRHLTVIGALQHYKVPVVVSVPVQFDDETEWSGTGNISRYDTRENIDGYHAVTVFAYDNNTHRFHFKNSWGSAWGNKGCGTFSYDFFDLCVKEAWIGLRNV